MKSLQELYYESKGLALKNLIEDIPDFNAPDDDNEYDPHVASVKLDPNLLKNLLTIKEDGVEVSIKLGELTVGMFLEEDGKWYVFLNGNPSNKHIAVANSKEEAFGKYINYLMG